MNSSQTKQDPQQNNNLSNLSGFEIKIRQLLEIKDDLDMVFQKLLFKIKGSQLYGSDDATTCQKNWSSSYDEEEYISRHLDEFIVKYDDDLSKLPIAILFRILNGYFSQSVNERAAIPEDILSRFFFHCLDSHEGDQKRSILVSAIHFEEKKFEVYKTLVEKYEDVAHSNYISHLLTEVITQMSENEKQMALYNTQREFIPIIFVVFAFSIYLFLNQFYKQKILSQKQITENSFKKQLRNMELHYQNWLQGNIDRNDELTDQIKNLSQQINQVSTNHRSEMNSLNNQMNENNKTLRNQFEIIQNNISSGLKELNESIFIRIKEIEEKTTANINLINEKLPILESNVTKLRRDLEDLYSYLYQSLNAANGKIDQLEKENNKSFFRKYIPVFKDWFPGTD